MKVVQLQPSVARSLQPVLRVSEAGRPGWPVTAFVSPAASPQAITSDVAALAVPIPEHQPDDDPHLGRLLRTVFGSSTATSKQLKGTVLILEGVKGFDPSLAQVAKVVAVVAATSEVIDALEDEDGGRWDALLKTGKLVVASGNLATDYADAIPGIVQAAPYLTALAALIKVGDGAMLLFRSDDEKDEKKDGKRAVERIQAYASGTSAGVRTSEGATSR